MLKHAYDYSEYKVLLLSCGGEVLSPPEYVITGLEDLLAERLADGDESFMVGEHLLHAHMVPDLHDKYKVPPLSLGSAGLFSKRGSSDKEMEEELKRAGSSLQEKQNHVVRQDNVIRSLAEDSSMSRMSDPDPSRVLYKSQRFNNKEDEFVVEQNEQRRNEFLRKKQQMITELWHLDPVDEEAFAIHTSEKERRERERKEAKKAAEKAQQEKMRRKGASLGQSTAAAAMSASAVGGAGGAAKADREKTGEVAAAGAGGVVVGTGGASGSRPGSANSKLRPGSPGSRPGSAASAAAAKRPGSSAGGKKSPRDADPHAKENPYGKEDVPLLTGQDVVGRMNSKSSPFGNEGDEEKAKRKTPGGSRPGSSASSNVRRANDFTGDGAGAGEGINMEVATAVDGTDGGVFKTPSRPNSPLDAMQRQHDRNADQLQQDDINFINQSDPDRQVNVDDIVDSIVEEELAEDEDILDVEEADSRYCRETYLDQVFRGVDIMEEFFLNRTVPAGNIYRYDFSQVSDEHPQDILEAFLQMPGKKLIYYVGHTSLDGGWFFTWRNSVGMPDNWILRPADFEFGPPDRAGTPFVIVDGSYTKCWMEPSCKFICLACLDGPADGGGRRGPILTRALTGIDIQEMLRPLAEAPKVVRKKDVFQLQFSSDTDGSLEMVRDPHHDRAGAFWQTYNRNYGDAFRESDTYLPAPSGTKIRIDDNYEDSVVIRLPLYIVLYNKPTMDAVWSLRAVLEVANFQDLKKVRVFGILPLILLIIAGEGAHVSKTDVNSFGGLATVKAGLGHAFDQNADDQNLIDALEGGAMSEDAKAALEKSKQVVASGAASKLGKKRQQLEREEGERQSFAKGDKTWMFKTEQSNDYKKEQENKKHAEEALALSKIDEKGEEMFLDADEGPDREQLEREIVTPTGGRRHHGLAVQAVVSPGSGGGNKGTVKFAGVRGTNRANPNETPEQAMMRQEAVLVLGLLAPVLRLDEIEKQALPVLTQYVSDTNNYCGWKVLGKLGKAFTNQTLLLATDWRDIGGRLPKIRTKIAGRTWRDKLDEYFVEKTEAIGLCGAGLVNVSRDQLVRDCEKSLVALVQLNAALPRWCRMESVKEARLGCRLLAEGDTLNPKLAFKTLMAYPFDPEVLQWGLLSLSRGGYSHLDPETAYIPVVNALTLKGNKLEQTFASASLCFERFLANKLWTCNIWDTCSMFLKLICERGSAEQVCTGLLAAVTSLHQRFLRDGEAPPAFTWRPLTEAVLTKITHQKTLDTLITAMAIVVEYERKRGHHTNGNSLAIDLVNHWDEFLARATVQEVIPAYRYCTRMMKEVFYQPEELEAIAKEEARRKQLFLDAEDDGKKKKKKKGGKDKDDKKGAGAEKVEKGKKK
eukprot:g12512.t1